MFDNPEKALHSLRKLKENWTKNLVDKIRTSDLIEMSEGKWSNSIPKMPKEPIGNNKRTVAPNILGFILDSFSYLYRNAPVRKLDSEFSLKLARDRLWNFDLGLDPTMQKVDSLARVSGTVLLELCYFKADSVFKEKGFRVKPHSSDKFEAVFTDDPRYITACVIQHGSGYIYWDEKYRVEFDSFWTPLPSINGEIYYEHQLGAVPFVPFQNSYSDEVIANNIGGKDLWNNILNLGSYLRECGWTAMLQRGQPVVTGELVKELILAPDYAIHLEENATFDIKENKANLAEIRSTVQFMFDLFARCMGLPSRTFRIDSRDAISAVSVQVGDFADLESDRQRRVPQARDCEKRLLKRASEILVKVEAATLDTSGFDITFNQPDTVTVFTDRLQRVGALYTQKLISPVDYVSQLYPTMTEKELADFNSRAVQFWGKQYGNKVAEALGVKKDLGSNQYGEPTLADPELSPDKQASENIAEMQPDKPD